MNAFYSKDNTVSFHLVLRLGRLLSTTIILLLPFVLSSEQARYYDVGLFECKLAWGIV